MLGILCLQVAIGLVLYALSKLLLRFFSFSSVSRRLLKEGLLTLLVFNSFNFAFAAGVHFNHSDPNNDAYTLNTIVAYLSLIIPVVMAGALIFSESKGFGQFKEKFKRQKICQVYFVISILYRYILGYYIGAKTNDGLQSLVVVFFSLLFLMYNFVNLPFNSALHNYRANICHLSQFVMIMVANYYEVMKSSTPLE